MKILVTGSRGFLGRAVVRRALEAGHEVLGVDLSAEDKEGPSRSGAPGCMEIPLDLLRLGHGLPEELSGAEAVIHCAALLLGDPDAVRRVNVEGTRNLLNALAASGTMPRFVLLSSMAIF